MTPEQQLAYLRKLASEKGQTRISSAFDKLSAYRKTEELKRALAAQQAARWTETAGMTEGLL